MNSLIKNENIVLQFDRPGQARLRADVRGKILSISDYNDRYQQELWFLYHLKFDKIEDSGLRFKVEQYTRDALQEDKSDLLELGPSAELQLRDAYFVTEAGQRSRYFRDKKIDDVWQSFNAKIDMVLSEQQCSVSRIERLSEASKSWTPTHPGTPKQGRKK